MMKHLILIIMLTPLTVFASELSINCQKKSEYLVCPITANSDTEVSAISLTYIYENLDYISGESTTFLGEFAESKIDLYTDTNQVNSFDVGTLKFKSTNNDYSINLDNVIFYDEKFSEIKDISVKNVKSKNVKNNKLSTNIIICVIIILVIAIIVVNCLKKKRSDAK